MFSIKQHLHWIIFIVFSLCINSTATNKEPNTIVEDAPLEAENTTNQITQSPVAVDLTHRTITEIRVHGNTNVSTHAILNKIPYRIGQPFDPNKSRETIRNLYYDFKRFRSITIFAEPVSNDTLILHIVITEKVPLKEIIFEGNSAVTQKEINEKITLLDTPALDPEELKIFSNLIVQLYQERGYYNALVDPELLIDDAGKGTLVFHINEGSKSLVKRILFKGNHHITGKTLRSILYTREDWLLSFMDKSGTFIPERLEGDKQAIEMYYQSHGYMNAKVIAIHPELDECTQHFTLLFDIQEGDLYTINCITIPGNELISENELLKVIPIKPGDLYSRENIVDAIKNLELVWGSFGYLNAHIEPSIIPNDNTKTVDLSFRTDLGNKITLGKLTIRGNKKTRDKIIRRYVKVFEGDLLTNIAMEQSKEAIQSLGYFDQRDGVNWKVIYTAPDTADLDLLVKEVKTGHVGFQLGFAGNPDSIREPLKGASVQIDVGDTNLFGTGMSVNLNSRYAHEDLAFGFNITQPWMFDRPIFGALDVYHKRSGYEDLSYTSPINEIDTGFLVTSGFFTSRYTNFLPNMLVKATLGFDNVRYNPANPKAVIHSSLPELEQEIAKEHYTLILNKMFNPGNYSTLMLQMGNDRRSHPIHPTNGYSWLARALVSFNFTSSCLGFQKYDIDAHWFTPLIGAYDLIFHLHGYVGIIVPFKNKLIPYKELFHIGGPASVRGFLWGEIGPRFNVYDIHNQITKGDSIGGTKGTWINAELIFPITADMNFKGVLFYDGGAGWDNPYADCVEKRFIKNNNFNYRHSVGFGIRIYNPMPIKIDWGFKLDPRKGEPSYEVHFNSSYEW